MRPIVLSAIFFLSTAVAGTRAADIGNKPTDARPNIVVILADDMGYSDLGCFGGEIQTPNIDNLAAHGIRLSQFYNCSRCCQTRASLLTGAYAQRVGLAEFGATMNLEVPTLAERLKTGGYQTAIMGKWHLSELPASPGGPERVKWLDHQVELPTPLADPASLPTHRGFEKFYGIVWGVVDHFDPFSLMENQTPVTSVPKDFYLTDAIADHSVSFVKEAANSHRPFFLYVAFEAPHWPIQARPEDIAKYKSKYDDGWDEMRRRRFHRQVELGLFEGTSPLGDVITQGGPAWKSLPNDKRSYLASKMEVHAAMVDRVDQGVGRIVESLRSTNQLDNTVIFVLSDNGASPEIPGEPGYDRNGGSRDGRPALRDAQLQLAENRDKLGSEESYTGIGPAWASASNTPLRYWKMESYEGGCRTPLVIHWPAGLKRSGGTISKDIGHVIDLAPTCLDLAHVDTVGEFKMDGISLLPVLEGKPLQVDRTLYFAHRQGRGVRHEQWKASKLDGHGWELFNLNVDPGETRDISGQKPEVLNSLVRELAAWRRQISQEQQSHGGSKATNVQQAAEPAGAQ
jgi:arylsulfatase A-like enzyme